MSRTQTARSTSILASGMAMVRRVLRRHRDRDSLAAWSVLYLDQDARMQRMNVHVLSIHPFERRLLATCSKEGRPRVFRVSRIVEARDLETGTPVNVSQWVQSFYPVAPKLSHRHSVLPLERHVSPPTACQTHQAPSRTACLGHVGQRER